MQYGLDSAAIASLQAMPGFLKVFGYPDANSAGGYAIGVSDCLVWNIKNSPDVHEHCSRALSNS